MSFLVDDRVTVDAQPVRLPAPPAPDKPTPFPWVAAIVPVLGAGMMFAMTRSPFMLIFAALGPLMLIGSLWDRRRGRRKEKKRHVREMADALSAAIHDVDARHEAERAARRTVHPSLATLCAEPAEVWRTHPQRSGALVVGAGTVRIAPRIEGEGDSRVAELRSYASSLTDAPVVVPLDGGVCIRGPRTIGRAVARALVLQVAAMHPPGSWQITARGDAARWVAMLPHAAPAAGARTMILSDASDAETADIVIRAIDGGAAIPPGSTTVIDIVSALRATISRGSTTIEAQLEAISLRQAESLARALGNRAQSVAAATDPTTLLRDTPAAASGVLGVHVGIGSAGPCVLDLVADGPHAVVVGTTGAGKSEFLVSWVLAMARVYSPQDVMFMLADFKGGTAFEPLAALPHVAGVLTDLDGSLAGRAVKSLAAEVRRREAVITDAGARDVTDPRVKLPRLVVIVDEYPALLTQHPDLEPVFTDIAARGRALGIHLVLGGQRVAGVVREAVLANCPLRVALRVSEGADSRAVIGGDEAARISGGPDGRGVAYVRRASDNAAGRVRFALSTAEDIELLLHDPPPPASPLPWLPPLGVRLLAADIATPGAIAVADEPDTQSQPLVFVTEGERGMAILGGPRSGKSTAALMIANELPGAVWLGPDPESAWDAIVAAEADPPRALIVDDVDVLAAAFPEPWGAEFSQRLDLFVRRAGTTRTTVVLTAQRPSGPTSRVFDLLPRRALLAVPSRADHLAAGGRADDFTLKRPPGRAFLDGVHTQFLLPDDVARAAPHTMAAVVPASWAPAERLVGLVTRAGRERITRVASRWHRRPVVVSDLPAGVDLTELSGVLLVGEPESWQRAWQVTDAVRRTGQLIITSECAPDVRVLTGDRRLVPYARAGRAWVVSAGHAPQRVAWE